MNKTFKLITACLMLSVAGCHSATNEKKVGIIVPIEHKAMNEIVAGFTDTIKAEYPHAVSFKIANAQGDMNLERAIIQQMKDEGYDVVAPIGTDASQMSASVIHNAPVISIAASISDSERKAHQPCNVAVVHDEISSAQLLQFVHTVYPQIKNLVLIHSTSDKVFPEVDEAKAAGLKYGITVKNMMVSSLNELYSTANNIPDDTQGILVLKDSLIVSGITTLEISAQKRHIPLITSDQGSVQDGAAFALGVHEREIGVESGKLAAEILQGKSACDLPIVEMTKLTVFVNKAALAKEQQSLDPVLAAAKQMNYKIEYTDAAQGAKQ